MKLCANSGNYFVCSDKRGLAPDGDPAGVYQTVSQTYDNEMAEVGEIELEELNTDAKKVLGVAVAKQKFKSDDPVDARFCDVLRTSAFWAVGFSAFFFNLFWAGFNVHSTNIMEIYAGLTHDQTANSVFLPLAIGIGVSAFITGVCMDRWSTRLRMFMLAVLILGLVGVMLSLLFLVHSSTSAVVFALVYGLFLGARAALMGPMYAVLFGTANLGKIQGVGVGMAIISSGLGPLMFGVAKDNFGSYTVPVVVCVGMNTLVGGGLFWQARKM